MVTHQAFLKPDCFLEHLIKNKKFAFKCVKHVFLTVYSCCFHRNKLFLNSVLTTVTELEIQLMTLLCNTYESTTKVNLKNLKINIHHFISVNMHHMFPISDVSCCNKCPFQKCIWSLELNNTKLKGENQAKFRLLKESDGFY